MNTAELLDFGSKILKHNKIVSYRLDSEVILSNILNIPRESLLTKEYNVSEKKITKFKALISRRSKSEPIAYIFKRKEFRSKDLFVDRKSLIPRPETEIIIDILRLNNIHSMLEIGTGSGCIAITASIEKIAKNIIATDISEKAIYVAKQNMKISNS